jgi:hypothetical protein
MLTTACSFYFCHAQTVHFLSLAAQLHAKANPRTTSSLQPSYVNNGKIGAEICMQLLFLPHPNSALSIFGSPNPCKN